MGSIVKNINENFEDVHTEINKVYNTMIKFFSATNERVQDHEERIENLEYENKLLRWMINIRATYKNFDGVTKFVYLVKDFLELTKDFRYALDFNYLKTAMENLELENINWKDFVREIGKRNNLYNHLLGEGSKLDEFATEYEPIIIDLKEAKEGADRKVFIASESVDMPNDTSEIAGYDFAVELIYNLEQVKYAKEFHDKQEHAKKLFLDCKIEEALPLLEELAEANSIQSRYILVLIYREGIKNPDYYGSGAEMVYRSRQKGR